MGGVVARYQSYTTVPISSNDDSTVKKLMRLCLGRNGLSLGRELLQNKLNMEEVINNIFR